MEPLLPNAPIMRDIVVDRPIRYSYEGLLKQVRSWAIWSLILGVVHLIINQFVNPYWGVLLIFVGLISFYFRTASMFIVYAITLLWAAFSNAISGGTGWVYFSVLQLYFVITIVRDFLRYRKIEGGSLDNNTIDADKIVGFQRASKQFPIIGFVLGLISFLGIFFFWGIIFIHAIISPETKLNGTLNTMLDIDFGVSQILAVLALGICTAALVNKYETKALSILGLLASLPVIVMRIWLFTIK